MAWLSEKQSVAIQMDGLDIVFFYIFDALR